MYKFIYTHSSIKIQLHQFWQHYAVLVPNYNTSSATKNRCSFSGANGSCHHWRFVAAQYPPEGVQTLVSHMLICIVISKIGWMGTISILSNQSSSLKEASVPGKIVEVLKVWLRSLPVLLGEQKSSEVLCTFSFKPVCLSEIAHKSAFFVILLMKFTFSA